MTDRKDREGDSITTGRSPAIVETSGNRSPVALVRKVEVTQLLGRVSVVGASASGRPAQNSTRWIIDIDDQDTGVSLELILLDFRSGRPIEPDLMSFSFAPMSASFYDAKPRIAQHRKGVLQISTDRVAGSCLYRLSIDVMHSATR